jgi:alpha-mannosidase
MHPGLELHEMNITRDDPAQVTPISWPRGGSWPDSFSLINIEPAQLVLSAIRQSDNGIIVRFYNVTRQSIDGTVTCGIPLAAANRLNLAEEFQESLTV